MKDWTAIRSHDLHPHGANWRKRHRCRCGLAHTPLCWWYIGPKLRLRSSFFYWGKSSPTKTEDLLTSLKLSWHGKIKPQFVRNDPLPETFPKVIRYGFTSLTRSQSWTLFSKSYIGRWGWESRSSTVSRYQCATTTSVWGIKFGRAPLHNSGLCVDTPLSPSDICIFY